MRLAPVNKLVDLVVSHDSLYVISSLDKWNMFDKLIHIQKTKMTLANSALGGDPHYNLPLQVAGFPETVQLNGKGNEFQV